MVRLYSTGGRPDNSLRVGNQYGPGSRPTPAIKKLLETWHFANQTSWSDSAVGIEVRFCDDLDNEIAVYNIDHGRWQHISGDIP